VRAFLISTILALGLTACDDRESHGYRGVLYFGQGAYLMRFSLQEGSLSVKGHLGDTILREVSGLGSDHLLVAETASVNRRKVPRISLFDLRTGESADLYAGLYARYLAVSGLVVYDDGSELFVVPQLDDSANRIIFSHSQNQLTHMIEAAPGTLLFEVGEAGEPTIHAWNSLTDELRELDDLTTACRLEGAVWLAPLERLACKRRDSPPIEAEYVLSDLDGAIDGRLNLPAGNPVVALGYIDSQQALVLQETRKGMLGARETFAVLMYDINSGESDTLASNVYLGASVVFAEF
jgi:hypothetical protein